MKSLLKSSLLAASVAFACGTAVAGDLNVTTATYSKQGTAGLTAAVTAPAVTYTLGAAYKEDDELNISVTPGALDDTFAWPSTLTFTVGPNGATATVGLLDSDGDSANYRFNTVDALTGQDTIGATVTLPAFLLDGAVVASSTVTVSISSKASNGVSSIDSAGTRTVKLTESKDQFGNVTVDPVLDSVVDVAQERKAFLVGADDSLTWAATNDTTLTNAVDIDAATVVLYGSFGSMDETAFTSAGTAVVDADAGTVTFTYGAGVTTDTITITPLVGDDAEVLKAQEFTLKGAFTYNTTSTEDLGVANAGEWTLNGAMVNVPYMPYSPNASQIVYVTNAGTQDGDIMVTAFDDKGNEYDLGTIGTAAANRVTKVTSEISEGLEGAGFQGGKVSLTITVNAPEDDITVYASYNVGGADRGFVNTSQYKGK